MRPALPGLAAAVALAALAAAGGCRSDDDRHRLNSRCEVPLEELATPRVRLEDFFTDEGVDTGLDPNRECELFLFDHDAETSVPTGLELIDAGRWEVDCVDAPDAVTGCRLSVDDELVHEYDDGVMLCWRLDGECGDTPAGRRTVCRAGRVEQVDRTTAAVDGPGTAAVLSIASFPSSGLVAVTWMRRLEEEGRGPSEHEVTWLRIVDDAPSYVGDIDLCEGGGDGDAQAEDQAHVAAQTATRGDAVLIASPCGRPGLAEVRPDDSPGAYDVVDGLTLGVDGLPCPTPEAALGVFEVDGGYVASWTDGLALYTSFLEAGGDGGLRPVSCRRIADTLDTQSRDEPSAICFEHPELSADPICAVAWSEVTRFSSAGPLERGGERESSIHFGLLTTDERIRQAAEGFGVITGDGIGQGFGPRLAARLAAGNPLDRPAGIVVYRNEALGLLARGWQVTGALGLGPVTTTLSDGIVHFTDAAPVSDFAMYWATPSSFTVAWIEPRRDGPFGLAAAVVGLRPEGPDIARTALSIPGFDAEWRPGDASGWDAPRPQVTRGFVDYGLPSQRAVLLVAAQDTREGECRTGFAVADLTPVMGLPDDLDDWPLELTLELLGEPAVVYETTPGACVPGCGGVASFDGAGFVVALPDAARGASLWSVSPAVAATRVARIDVPDMGGEPGCAVSLTISPDGATSRVFWDAAPANGAGRVLRGLALTRAEDGRWSAARRDVTIDGAASRSASRPAEPVVFGDVSDESASLLLWRENPFGDWPQGDFRLGRVEDGADGDAIGITTIGYPYASVVDSRVSSALGLPVACDDEGEPTGENLCALIAFDRPDYGEFRDVGGYNRLSQLTPVVETYLAPVGREPVDVAEPSLFTPVELLPGQAWRGLPTSLVGWDAAAGHPVPLGAFSQASPLGWGLGSAAVFTFQRPWAVGAEGGLTEPVATDPTGASHWLWQAQDVSPSWMFGDPSGDREIPMLRLAPAPGNRLAGVWTGRVPSANGATGRDDVSVNLTLLSVELELVEVDEGSGVYEARLRPVASRAVVDVDPDLDAVDPAALRNDERALLAEHLQAAFTPLPPADGETARFLVGWVDRDWEREPANDSDARIAAAVVTCETVETAQRPGEGR